MNLYIFNESSKAAVYGIGTYLRELTDALRHNDINVCVINLWADKPQIQIEKINDVQNWYFPAPIPEQWTIDHQKRIEQYYRNVAYLLQLHITDKKNLIFHLNFMTCKPLVDLLRSAFDCKIILVVHYLDSMLFLLGNISRLRRIISQSDKLIDEAEKSANKSFLKERELFHAVDKIICLSNHAHEMLEQVYLIDKEKLVVVHNGLSDVTVG